jgi:hypothetical protein
MVSNGIAWPAMTGIVVLVGMILFRRNIGAFIDRAYEVNRRGIKAEAPSRLVKKIAEQIARDLNAAKEDGVTIDGDSLVIRDSSGQPRILAGTGPGGEAFITIMDGAGLPRVVLAASSAVDVASSEAEAEVAGLLGFPDSEQAMKNFAAVIGSMSDGTGSVVVKTNSGELKEFS